MPNLFTAPLQSLTFHDLETFATTSPAPHEVERLDFKVQWSASVLESIVSMANNDGGLILVGVAEQKISDKPKVIQWPSPGIALAGILDRLASSCHAIIRPNFVPEAWPIPFPDDDSRGYLIIRIRSDRCPRPLWHEEKGILYRTGDQNRPADLHTVRHLLLEPARSAEADRIFSEWSAQAVGANAHGRYWLGVVAQYPMAAGMFDSEGKLKLVQVVLDLHNLSSSSIEIVGSRNEVCVRAPEASSGGRDLQVRFHRAGLALFQYSDGGRSAVPAGWVLENLHRALGSLASPSVREAFGHGDINLYASLSHWPSGGVDMSGLIDIKSLRPSGHSGYSMQEAYVLTLEEDHDRIILSFGEAVLADAGYMGHEEYLKTLVRLKAFRGTN